MTLTFQRSRQMCLLPLDKSAETATTADDEGLYQGRGIKAMHFWTSLPL